MRSSRVRATWSPAERPALWSARNSTVGRLRARRAGRALHHPRCRRWLMRRSLPRWGCPLSMRSVARSGRVWSRAMRVAFAPADMAYPDPAGYAPLREAIAGYLATSRAVLCKAGQILITNGYQDALNLAAGVLLLRGDKVWLEDPNYAPTSEALTAAGATLVPINVDAEGLRVSDGLTRARHARLAVVTPSHQSPLGVALSLPRRLALLSWASAAGAWIIEDDYDSEFHYVGPPATGAEKPRSRRARSLCRNLQQGFVPEPAARLLGPTGIAGCRLRALQSCATSGACDARAARGCRFHGRGLLRAPSQTHACPLFGTPPGVGGRP